MVRSRHTQRVTTALVGLLGLVGTHLASTPAAATLLRGEVAPSADEDPAVGAGVPADPEEVGIAVDGLLQQSRARRDAGEPTAMLPRLEEALARLDPEAVRREPDLRASMLLELAASHDAAFDDDGETEHLRLARERLDRLIAEAEHHGYAATLVDRALAMRARVDDRALRRDSQGPRAATLGPRAGDPHDGAPSSARRGIVTGWSLGGLGLATAAVAGIGLGVGAGANREVLGTTLPSDEARRVAADRRGRIANGLALGAGIAASALVLAATIALVTGASMRRRAGTREGARPRPPRRAMGRGLRRRSDANRTRSPATGSR